MSIKIEENILLAPMTTMKVGGRARFFVRVKNIDEIKEAVSWASQKRIRFFVLGGGANTVVGEKGFNGLVIKIECKGVSYKKSGEIVSVSIDAGEKWDDVVKDAVSRGLWGIENLSLIPGTAGGAAVQNIGAYGTALADVVDKVEVLDTKTMMGKVFLREECAFGYRESVFKKNPHLVVTQVTLNLRSNSKPLLNYEDVKKYFIEKGIHEPSLSEMREAIISIRTNKMPPESLGTAGSFFKNPLVSKDDFLRLQKKFPEIKSYSVGENSFKLSAAWLLDKVGGFRGFRDGDAGAYEKQTLILVNHGSATAKDIVSLAEKMKKIIKEKTNVTLEEEVVMMPE